MDGRARDSLGTGRAGGAGRGEGAGDAAARAADAALALPDLPVLLQDVTWLSLAACFDMRAVARRLPSGLRLAGGATGEASGGVEVLIARRTAVQAPFAMARIWVDLDSPHPDRVAPRFLLAQHVTRPLDGGDGPGSCGSDARVSHLPVPVRISLSEEGCLHSVRVQAGEQAVMQASLRSLVPGQPASGLTVWRDGAGGRQVEPWVALLADAEPVELEFLAPDLADLVPLAVYGAALATGGSATLGIPPGR